MTDQLYFDHGSDSFLSQVGQIMKIRKIQISIQDPPNSSERVCVTFGGKFFNPNMQDYEMIWTEQYGKSYGECLFKVREKIRELTGR